jgi:DNA-binding NtrC family response regulator
LRFCGLFHQNPSKDKNILASLKECRFSQSDIDQLDYSVSDEAQVKTLVKNIMKYLKGFEDPEYRGPENFSEYWSALEKMTNEDSLSETFENEEALVGIANLKEKDLLRHYYRKILERSGGNVKQAARRAGLMPSTFRSRMEKLRVKFKKKDTNNGDP